MPLFYTPKPRQFHYEPRFYDPEHEKWEALKKKYADRQASEDVAANATAGNASADDGGDEELRYFQERVRAIDRSKRQTRMTWRDLFRRREMPKFNYQPRFQSPATQGEGDGTVASDGTIEQKYAAQESPHRIRIRRRYNIEDPDYMKPMPASKIMIYGLLTFLLLFWILF